MIQDYFAQQFARGSIGLAAIHTSLVPRFDATGHDFVAYCIITRKTSVLRATYGMPFVGSLERMDRMIMVEYNGLPKFANPFIHITLI